jgi:lysophospholipase L1-like esterase
MRLAVMHIAQACVPIIHPNMSFPLFRFLLVVAFVLSSLLRSGADEIPNPHAKWEKEIAALEEKDRETPPEKGGIVFVGSSSIKLWKTLEQDFPHHRVLNRGFGGSQLRDAVYFADRIVIPYAPRMIVVYSGGNDINAGRSPEDVLAAFRAFVKKVRTKLPGVPIAYISIAGNPKRWAQVEKVKAANGMIKSYIGKNRNLKYIDVFSRMLGPDGMPLPDIFVEDNLHMNPKGYALWTEIVGAYLPAADKKAE